MSRFASVLVVVLAVTSSAAADDELPATSGAPTTPSEASAPTKPPSEHAKRGNALVKAGNCGGAIAEYEIAYHELERDDPERLTALYDIALCEIELFRYDRAMRNLQRYLDEAGPEATDRVSVQKAIKKLEALLGTLRIELVERAELRAEVWVDDRLAGEAPGDVLVPGGSHTVEIRAPGYEPHKRELSLAARTVQTLRIELRALASAGPSMTYFWVAGGATLATAAVGIAFGLHAQSEADAIEAREADPIEHLKLIDRDGDAAGRAALTADILFGASGLLAVTTAVLFFVVDWDADQETPIRITTDGRRAMVQLRGHL